MTIQQNFTPPEFLFSIFAGYGSFLQGYGMSSRVHLPRYYSSKQLSIWIIETNYTACTAEKLFKM